LYNDCIEAYVAGESCKYTACIGVRLIDDFVDHVVIVIVVMSVTAAYINEDMLKQKS